MSINNNPHNYDFDEPKINSNDPINKTKKSSLNNKINKKYLKYIIIISVIGLLLIGAIIGIIIFLKGKKNLLKIPRMIMIKKLSMISQLMKNINQKKKHQN